MKRKLLPLLLMCALLGFCGWWQPHNIDTIDLAHRHEAPSLSHLLGTDHLGRDFCSRLMAGAGHTLIVLLSIGFISFFLGTLFGLIAGLSQGLMGRMILRLADFVIIMPTLVMAITFTALFGLNPVTAGISLGLGSWGPYAILTYNLTRRVTTQPYILAAKAVGVGPVALLRRYIIPNIGETLFTYLASDCGRNVLNYAALAYLGLGADTSRPDWGSMLFEYRMLIFENPWLMILPGVAIFLTSLVLNLLFDPGPQKAS